MPLSIHVVRFGGFEADLRARELRRRGLRLRLQEKPFQILEILLSRAGQVVTRQELRSQLWPDTHVGYDRSLNTAISSLRHVLGDSSRNPRFLETCQRRGYRFIGPVENLGDGNQTTAPEAVDSIAVLPLHNDTGDPDMEYLSDGVTESVIKSLSAIPGLRVMARSTVFRFKGRETDPLAVGRELNVRAVVTGSVRRHGDQLGISLEAVDVRSGWQIWGEQFHRMPTDLFALQDEICRNLSTRLQPKFSQEQAKSSRAQFSPSTDAYQDYLKGRYFLNKMTEDGLRRGISHFTRAIERDPQYAPAYTGLADCYSLCAFFSLQAPKEVLPKAKEAAEQAVELDDGLAEAHLSLAGVFKSYEWNWDAAEREFRRALELNPNHATGHHLYADFLSTMGRATEAIHEIQLAQALDPLSLVISNEVAWNLYMAGRYEDALEQSLKTLELEQGFSAAHHTLGLCCEQLGRFEEAIREHEAALRSSGGNPASLAGLGHAYAKAGHRSEAAKILEEIRVLARRAYTSAYQTAILYAGLNEFDSAIEWLLRAVNDRDVWLVWLKRDPRLAGLHSDSRFGQILATMGFDQVRP